MLACLLEFINQLWKLFREFDDEVFWNPGSSMSHPDLFLKESLFNET